MEIRIYDDLVKHHLDIAAWSSRESFEISKLNLADRRLLENINVVEVISPGNQGNRENQRVFNLYESFVKNFLATIQIDTYLVTIEYMAQRRNRIRSYKGIIKRSIIKQDFIEEEVEVGNEETVIIGMVKIKKGNYPYLFDKFYGTNCFILVSPEEIFTREYLVSFIKRHVILDKIVIVDYLSLVLNEIKNNNMILRTAGDGGDVEVDLQIFANKHLLEGLIKNARYALKDL